MKVKILSSGWLAVLALLSNSCGRDEARVPVKVDFSGLQSPIFGAALTDTNSCKLAAVVGDNSAIGVIYLVAHYTDKTADYFLLDNVYFDITGFDTSFSSSNIDFSRVQTSFNVKPRSGVRFALAGVIFRHKDVAGNSDGGGTNGWGLASVAPGVPWNACTRSAANHPQNGYTDASHFPIVVSALSSEVNITEKNQSVSLSNIEFYRTPINSTGGNPANVDDNAIPASCATGMCGDAVRGFDGYVDYNSSGVPTDGSRTPATLGTNTGFVTLKIRLSNPAIVANAPVQFAFQDVTVPSPSVLTNSGWLPFPCEFRDKGTHPVDGSGNLMWNNGEICKGHHYYVANIGKPAAGSTKIIRIRPFFPNRKYRLVLATYLDKSASAGISHNNHVYDEQILNDSLVFETGFNKTVCVACDISVNTSATSGISRLGILEAGATDSACTTSADTWTSPAGGSVDCRRTEINDFILSNPTCVVESSCSP